MEENTNLLLQMYKLFRLYCKIIEFYFSRRSFSQEYSVLMHVWNIFADKRKRYGHKCSAQPHGCPCYKKENRWHRERGFDSIGYHYIIYLDGSIRFGRPVEQAGAHCKGHNANSIGVCYVGGLSKDGKTSKDTRTPLQKLTIKYLLMRLKANNLCALMLFV